MDLSLISLPGAPLEHVETYVDYDGPQTFALRATVGEGSFYVVNSVEDDEDGHITYLAARMSELRFQAVRSGKVPLAQAFTAAGLGELYRLIWAVDEGTVEVSTIDPSTVPEDYLPGPDVLLNLKTKTVEPFDPQSVANTSLANNRTILAVELNAEGSNTTEFPGKALGEFTIALNRELDALFLEVTTKKDDLLHLTPSVVGLRAASFVVLIAFDSDALTEPTEWTGPVVDRLNNLLTAAASENPSDLIDSLKTHSPAVRNRFRDMLTPLAHTGSSLGITSSIAGGGELTERSLDAVGVRRAQHAIVHAKPAISRITVRRGVLVGLNLRTRRFELSESASGKTFKGYVDPGVLAHFVGLSVGGQDYIAARIRVEAPFDLDPDEAEGVRHFIEKVGPSPDPASGSGSTKINWYGSESTSSSNPEGTLDAKA